MTLLLLSQFLLDTAETSAIIQALAYINLAPEDLSYNKDWVDRDSFRLMTVDRLMAKPMDVPHFADSCRAEIARSTGNPTSTMFLGFSFLDVRLSPKDTNEMRKRFEKAMAGKKGWEAGLAYLRASWDEADAHRQKAFSRLSRPQIDTLLYYSLSLWADEGDTLLDTLRGCLLREFGFPVDTAWCDDSSRILELAALVDWRELALGALAFSMGVEEITMFSQGIPEGSYSAGQWRVLVKGEGDDVHPAETTALYHLILDKGGSDAYYGRPGGSVGFLGRPLSAVIDLYGNDAYLAEDFVSLGAGLMGYGALVDLSGDDLYRAPHYTMGMGLFGAGFLSDKAGDDLYYSGFFAQSAAMFGVSYMHEGGGDDVMRAFSCAQAFSSVKGCAILDEVGGDDVYYAGGEYLHKPLLEHNYRAFAQGYSIGIRPRASGGISVLLDREGNDLYQGEVYAQGCSYWYSAGILLDLSGDDFYSAVQYAQGSGIHLSVGLLGDYSGSDHYYSRYGPSQGEGHDLAVGWLIDKRGNDNYQVSGGLGIGLTNSVGIFVDSDGDDTYSTREDIGLGDANRARDAGGVGIFLDLSGKDNYPAGTPCRNGRAWTRGMWGLGWDRQ
ncbi:MAG: hypothetical protein ABIM46_08960 [candidate division WOR-3 bacterium]